MIIGLVVNYHNFGVRSGLWDISWKSIYDKYINIADVSRDLYLWSCLFKQEN